MLARRRLALSSTMSEARGLSRSTYRRVGLYAFAIEPKSRAMTSSEQPTKATQSCHAKQVGSDGLRHTMPA